jgi:hypothetical protein
MIDISEIKVVAAGKIVELISEVTVPAVKEEMNEKLDAGKECDQLNIAIDTQGVFFHVTAPLEVLRTKDLPQRHKGRCLIELIPDGA